MTKQQVAIILTTLRGAYPRQKIERATIDVYTTFLQDLDYKTTQKVVAHHVSTEKWFPTIAEIREAYVELIHSLPTVETAMETIKEAVRGSKYELINSHYLVRQAVDTVGYEKLGRSEYPDALYRQIREAYENLRKREVKRLQNTPAAGAKALGEGLICGD